jgi:putative endopeptidase
MIYGTVEEVPRMRVTSVAIVILAGAAFAADPKISATPGFDIRALDTAADPCVDFYQYACGSWIAKNPIPPDRSSWGRFDELYERNQIILRGILEKYSTADAKRNPLEQKIGDYYSACMDETGIEKAGLAPLEPELRRIRSLTDKTALADEIARLHLAGANALFRFISEQDAKDSTQEIARADQGGLGLPERDYYVKDDARSVEIRQQYLAHMQKMFALLGESGERAAADAQIVMDIETALARASLDLVSRRDPAKTYHKVRTADLAYTLNPAFHWTQYLQAIDAQNIESLNVAVPEFFKQLDGLINTTELENWKAYLTWHLVRSQAAMLPSAFVNERFNFYGTILTGAKELRPRWKRCVQEADGDLGEALGRKYVEQNFGADSKERVERMVAALERAMDRDIADLPWMTPATKRLALIKLKAIANKIGYPDQWRDYSSLKIARGDALGNSQRSNAFEFRRELAKIGKPVDRLEWQMTPPTVNAYYDAQMNDINFPAGFLQPPAFDRSMDDAVNFGNIGSTIGHELTHGFDDEGRQFDAKGNLRDWWTADDAREFEKRAACMVDEYSGFTVVDDLKLNGKLTLGENAADAGGLRIAYMALLDTLSGKTPPKIDGYTAEQRFFLGYAQGNCENLRDEIARLLAQTDPHSPGKYRANGVVSNMPEFHKAFGCTAGQPMVRAKACRVW